MVEGYRCVVEIHTLQTKVDFLYYIGLNVIKRRAYNIYYSRKEITYMKVYSIESI
jgi:hypothetical protein